MIATLETQIGLISGSIQISLHHLRELKQETDRFSLSRHRGKHCRTGIRTPGDRFLNGAEIAALTGTAPVNRDSGCLWENA
ncbi:MAG: hypothetical protein R2941_25425 [Desulfobacterales bacterium]